MDEQRPPGIEIGQIFLRSVQFEHREDALAVPPHTRDTQQRVGVQIQYGEQNDPKAIALAIRIFSDPESKEALYRYSIEMVALVSSVDQHENMPLREYALKAGVATLFPFLREMLANLTMRGRFGPIWLSPFNVQSAVDEMMATLPQPRAKT